jgi:hypothetical protein
MIRINLLPQELRRGHRISVKLLAAAVGAAAVACAAIGWFGLVYFGDLGEVERQHRQVAQELAEKSVKATYYEKLEANRKDYQSRVQTIQEIAKSRRLWTKFLDELIDIVNNDGDTERHLAWFDSMTVTGDPKRGISVMLPAFVQGGIDKQSNLYDDIDAGPFASEIKAKSDPGGKSVTDKNRDPPDAFQFPLKLDFWPLAADRAKGAKK